MYSLRYDFFLKKKKNTCLTIKIIKKSIANLSWLYKNHSGYERSWPYKLEELGIEVLLQFFFFSSKI